MREPWIGDDEALRERMSDPGQDAPNALVPDMPPYVMAFLAHVRLLVGVPFDYLVPDPLMLPNESVRFFHLDRSWTDRLADGVLAVGAFGTREQAHYRRATAQLTADLDELEPNVRPIQRGLASIADRAATAEQDAGQPISGMLLRSALVSGWPQMDVVAYSHGVKLTLLRLERLAPAVLIALWAGIPTRIQLEEPHHGIQFGGSGTGPAPAVMRRRADGRLSPSADDLTSAPGSTPAQREFPLAFRDDMLQVVEIAALRRILSYEADLVDPPRNVDDPPHLIGMPVQTGSAAFTVELLQPPWRQVWDDDAGPQPTGPQTIRFKVRDLAAAFDTGRLTVSLGEER